ncbi:MAG: hypothetical protein SNI45_06670 [Rikenellaceae bacterium]
MKRLIIILFVAVGLASCFNSTEFDTDCIISPVTQVASGEDYIDLEGVVCYAFEGTTDDWEILSYEDALAGIATSVSGDQTLSPYVVASSYAGSLSQLSIYLDREYSLVVAVDPSSEIYTYIDYEVPHNLYELYVTLIFLPWKVANYTTSSWTYVVPPFETLHMLINVTDQASSDDEETTAKSSVKLYAFSGTTSDWSVASYEDAVAGVITSTSTTEQQSAVVEGTAVAGVDGEFEMTLDEGSYILVAADTEAEVYGYASYTVTAKVRTDTDEVDFCSWQSASYTSNGWSFILPTVEEEEEEEEESDEEGTDTDEEDETEI